MIVFHHKGIDPHENLYLENNLLRQSSRNILMFWRNSPSVIVGKNQVIETEVNTEYAEKAAVEIVQRRSGGGTVYHDLGTINFSFITDMAIEPVNLLQQLLSVIGIPGMISSRNDVLFNGKKIIGTAQYLYRKRRVFHGSLLYDTDLKVLSEILTPDQEKMQRHGINSVRARVANLKEFFPELGNCENYIEYLLARCKQMYTK